MDLYVDKRMFFESVVFLDYEGGGVDSSGAKGRA